VGYRRGRGPQTEKKPAAKYLDCPFFLEKLGFGVVIYIWSMAYRRTTFRLVGRGWGGGGGGGGGGGVRHRYGAHTVRGFSGQLDGLTLKAH
jgi:hypothetical protein